MPTYRIEIFRWPMRPEPSVIYLYGAADEAESEWFAKQGAIHLEAEHYTVRPDDPRPPLPRGRWERLWSP